jgi:hypothetical protein
VKGFFVVLLSAALLAATSATAFGVVRGNARTRSVSSSRSGLPARVVREIRQGAAAYAFIPTWVPNGFKVRNLSTSPEGWTLDLSRSARQKIRWGVAAIATPACNGQSDPGAAPYKAIRVAGHVVYWRAYTATTTPADIGSLPELQGALRCANTPSGVFREPGGGSAGVVTEMMTASTTAPASKLSPRKLARMVSSARWMGPPAQP